MIKLISKTEYKELLDYKKRYEEITGQRWYILTGGRSYFSRLMQLSKESLINLVLEMRKDIKNINKKLNKNYKCRIETEKYNNEFIKHSNN